MKSSWNSKRIANSSIKFMRLNCRTKNYRGCKMKISKLSLNFKVITVALSIPEVFKLTNQINNPGLINLMAKYETWNRLFNLIAISKHVRTSKWSKNYKG